MTNAPVNNKTTSNPATTDVKNQDKKTSSNISARNMTNEGGMKDEGGKVSTMGNTNCN